MDPEGVRNAGGLTLLGEDTLIGCWGKGKPGVLGCTHQNRVSVIMNWELGGMVERREHFESQMS